MLTPALSTAAAGVQTAFRRADAGVARTVQQGVPGAEVDLPREVVEQISAGHDLRANLAVLRTADEMLGALLDTRA